jgi:hypothetical protein
MRKWQNTGMYLNYRAAHLPSMCKALGSIPITTRKQKISKK